MIKKLAFVLVAVSACTTKPLEMSVPTQSGHTLHSARIAVNACSAEADIGGNSAVIGGYATAILLTSPLIGTIIGYNTQGASRTQGEIDQVDRCLTERGFERRNLTTNETSWLRGATEQERVRRLDHLVGGGVIETYGLAAVQ